MKIAGMGKEQKCRELAKKILEDGSAWKKFQAICEAQGGLRVPQKAAFSHEILAARKGIVRHIDNRRLAMVAKLAGAPEAAGAGLVLHAPLKKLLEKGAPLFTIHAESMGELNYALDYVAAQDNILSIEEEG
jgi:thymidine phosphorylase